MNRTRRDILLGTAGFGMWLVVGEAHAAPNEVQRRLMRSRKSERYAVEREGADVKAGAARIHVAAPADVVRKVVTDFRHYEDFIKRFEKSKVVGKREDKTDVYLKVPILHGAAAVWAIVRFEPPKTKGSTSVVTGRMLKGNVDRLDGIWTITPIDDKNTQLDLVLHIEPRIPAPNSLITKEVMSAAHKAVTGSRDRAEKTYKK